MLSNKLIPILHFKSVREGSSQEKNIRPLTLNSYFSHYISADNKMIIILLFVENCLFNTIHDLLVWLGTSSFPTDIIIGLNGFMMIFYG